MRPKKRFIAGAKCPACQALDRVVMYSLPEREWIECVDCGHRENRPDAVPAKTVTALATDASTVVGAEPGIVQFRP